VFAVEYLVVILLICAMTVMLQLKTTHPPQLPPIMKPRQKMKDNDKVCCLQCHNTFWTDDVKHLVKDGDYACAENPSCNLHVINKQMTNLKITKYKCPACKCKIEPNRAALEAERSRCANGEKCGFANLTMFPARELLKLPPPFKPKTDITNLAALFEPKSEVVEPELIETLIKSPLVIFVKAPNERHRGRN